MNFKEIFGLFVRGMAMGAANVIPGVSGGTIAFITGIYERLIDSLKSFNLQAVQLLFKGKWKEFVAHTDLYFIISLFLGVFVSIISLAKVLEYLFCNYEFLTLSFFFGLIIASVYSVGRQLEKWNAMAVLFLVIGTLIAVGIGFLNPANSNDSFIYLVLCGIAAICSMVLPGLSGSYVLLLMGNYLLVLSAISTRDMGVIIPVGIGAVIGLAVFSNLLSWLFKKAKDATIALLTGFVLGSLFIIWPWKTTLLKKNELGEIVDKYGNTDINVCLDGVVIGYERYLPSMNGENLLALLAIIVGIVLVLGIEKVGKQSKTEE